MKAQEVNTPRQLDPMSLIVIVGVAAIWIVGILMLCATGKAVRPEGLLMVIFAAMSTALLVIRSWVFRMDRAFVHGYHAGYHDATARECYPAEDCEVVSFAEVRARR